MIWKKFDTEWPPSGKKLVVSYIFYDACDESKYFRRSYAAYNCCRDGLDIYEKNSIKLWPGQMIMTHWTELPEFAEDKNDPIV